MSSLSQSGPLAVRASKGDRRRRGEALRGLRNRLEHRMCRLTSFDNGADRATHFEQLPLALVTLRLKRPRGRPRPYSARCETLQSCATRSVARRAALFHRFAKLHQRMRKVSARIVQQTRPNGACTLGHRVVANAGRDCGARADKRRQRPENRPAAVISRSDSRATVRRIIDAKSQCAQRGLRPVRWPREARFPRQAGLCRRVRLFELQESFARCAVAPHVSRKINHRERVAHDIEQGLAARRVHDLWSWRLTSGPFTAQELRLRGEVQKLLFRIATAFHRQRGACASQRDGFSPERRSRRRSAGAFGFRCIDLLPELEDLRFKFGFARHHAQPGVLFRMQPLDPRIHRGYPLTIIFDPTIGVGRRGALRRRLALSVARHDRQMTAVDSARRARPRRDDPDDGQGSPAIHHRFSSGCARCAARYRSIVRCARTSRRSASPNSAARYS